MIRSGARPVSGPVAALLRLGVPLGLTVALAAGCSSGSSAGTAGSSTAAPSSPAGASPASSLGASPPPGDLGFDKAVVVAVDGRKVLPSPGRINVKVGERVRLTVISDVDNVVHVHGVDIEKDVTADHPQTFVVVNTRPGVYEVELHRPALLLFQFVVR